MLLSSSYDAKEIIYSEHLRELKGIKLTLREIDIIACIIHNRSEKKIANILSIMPKTVSTHVANIMQKLRCNSKDNVIDFIETSGKIQFVRQYYLYLLLEGSFEKHLIKIGKLIDLQQLAYSINYEAMESSKQIEKLLAKMKEHLKLANVNLVIEKQASNEFLEELKQVTEEGYYNRVFKIIASMGGVVKNDEISRIINQFEEECKLLDNPIIDLEKLGQGAGMLPLTKRSLIIKLLFTLLIIFCLLLLILFSRSYQMEKKDDVSNILIKSFTDLSVDNTSIEQADKNYSIIRQFDKIIDQIILGEVPHLNIVPLKSDELVNCLYNLNAIGSYALFKEHDYDKAEKILKYAKTLAESYLLDRSKLQINFDELTPEEVYTELAIIKDLPEMYTITLYFLGRSYIYERNYIKHQSIKPPVRYFQIAKFLGDKLGLFEAFLSIRGGLALIKNDNIHLAIKQGELKKAQKELKENIITYIELAKDSKGYKVNYRPGDKYLKFVVPKEDIHNIIACFQRVIEYYTTLIAITDEPKVNEQYLQEVAKQLLDKDDDIGFLKILINKPSKVLARITAAAYNSLGYLLLKLHDKNLDKSLTFQELRQELVNMLNLNIKDDLDMIYQIFDLAKSLSRNTEFSKADSYEGLAMVLERVVKQGNISEDQQQELLFKIEKFRQMRDEINHTLKRQEITHY